MPIDASIYSQVKPVEMPSPLDAAQKAMTLSTLGMQQQQMQMQFQQQQALRQAYAQNVGPDGTVNKQGVLSALSRSGMGHMVPELGASFAKQDKEQADAQSAQMEAQQKVDDVLYPQLKYLKDHVAENQKPTVYHNIMAGLANVPGVPMHRAPAEFDPQWLDQTLGAMDQRKQAYELQATQADTAKKREETREIPSRIAKDVQEARKAKEEADNLAWTNDARRNALSDQTNDPAKLIAALVPKEHQAKAFEEVKNAQDVKALAPKILAAFDRGTSRNPVTAAQGRREFEGLINTTVKETEGTVRQAAVDSIHKTMSPSGTTALPGDNESRRRTVEEYLTSKSAAPFAKGFGVDLTKYDSTAPYQSQKRQTKPGARPGPAASNTPKPGAVEDGYVFNGGDPANPKNWMRAN